VSRYGNYDWLPGAYAGRDVWVVASGPSMRRQFPRSDDGELDLSLLRGKICFVISHVILFVPWADVMVVLDSSPLQKLGRDHYSKSYRTITSMNTNLEPRGRVAVIKYSDRLCLEPQHGFWGNHSTGQFAISAALCSGAKTVYLVGFDCQANPGDGNFYDTQKVKGYMYSDIHERYARMAGGFEKFAPVKDRIVNLSPDSAIETFPKANLEDVL